MIFWVHMKGIILADKVGYPTLSAMWQVSRQSDITDFYDCRGNWIRQHRKTLSRVNGKSN